MKSLLTFILLLFGSHLIAQTVERYSIDSGGASATNGNIEILYTLGETMIAEQSVGNIILSEGFISSSSTTLSIDKDHFLKEIVIYPNPARENIYIKSALPIKKIELYDILGKKVIETVHTDKITIAHLAAGIYYLHLYIDGQTVSGKKIIKEN